MNPNNGNNSVFDDVMSRIPPEVREAFLRSKINIEKHFGQHDEMLALTWHLEQFAAVIANLTSNTLPTDLKTLSDHRHLLSENVRLAKETQKISQDIRMSATIVANATTFHTLCVIVISFLCGCAFILLIELLRGKLT